MVSESELESAMTKILNGMSLSLVEMSIGRHRGDVKVNLVVHKPGGVSLDDLTAAQKVLRPRLELDFGREDLSLEIASPGTSRKIKNPAEYAIFVDCIAKLLVGDDWFRGRLMKADESGVEMETAEGKRVFTYDEIRKGKLDQ